MSLLRAYAMSYPPALVMPEKVDHQFYLALHQEWMQLAEELRDLKPDTVALISPLAPVFPEAFYVSRFGSATGDLGRLGAHEISSTAIYDERFSDQLRSMARGSGLNIQAIDVYDKRLDEASVIALKLIQKRYRDFKLLLLGLSYNSFKQHETLGHVITQSANLLGRKTVLIALTQLSPYLSHAGTDRPESARFDTEICRLIKKEQLDQLVRLDPSFCLNAGGTDVRSLMILSGAVGNQYQAQLRLYAPQTGIGQIAARFDIKKQASSNSVSAQADPMDLEGAKLNRSGAPQAQPIQTVKPDLFAPFSKTPSSGTHEDIRVSSDMHAMGEGPQASKYESSQAINDSKELPNANDLSSLNERRDWGNLKPESKASDLKNSEVTEHPARKQNEVDRIAASQLEDMYLSETSDVTSYAQADSPSSDSVAAETKRDESESADFPKSESVASPSEKKSPISDTIETVNHRSQVQAREIQEREIQERQLQERDVARKLEKAQEANQRKDAGQEQGSVVPLQKSAGVNLNSDDVTQRIAKVLAQSAEKNRALKQEAAPTPFSKPIYRLPLTQDPYVELAIFAIRYFIRYGEKAPLPENVPEKLLKQRAACFVSVYLHERLLGCIGTLNPQCEHLAQEIIDNALAACKEDRRFQLKSLPDAKQLRATVDVLGTPEAVHSISQLDPQQYGIVVHKGNRKGVLLPRLRGVKTVEQQLGIAATKAGVDVRSVEAVDRFLVQRHV